MMNKLIADEFKKTASAGIIGDMLAMGLAGSIGVIYVVALL